MNTYQGLRDRHLNVFINYGERSSEYLENNITKAFINTLQSLDSARLVEVSNELFKIELDERDPEKYSFSFFLQKKPSDYDKIVDAILIKNRILFAFCPDGKSMGIDGMDSKDEVAIRKYLKDYFSKHTSFTGEQSVEDAINREIENIRKIHNHGSIPDGWVLISEKTSAKCLYVIAMENKRYDLNPFQINNHLEKSLHIFNTSEKKSQIVYRKFSDIVDLLGNESYMCASFQEYLTILGFYRIDDFEAVCSADTKDDSKMRKNLLYKYFGEQLLKDLALSLKIPGIIDARDARTWRLKVNWPYLKEINLVFDEQKAYLSFAFGARQSDSLVMINNANKWLIDSKDFYSSGKIMQSFHLQYYRGRNIKESYVASFFNSIDDYISYWINHKTLIRKRSPEEAIFLYYQFLQDGIITQDEYGSLFNRLNGKKNPVLTIPEILYEPEWQYDTLAAIGIEQFESELFDSSKMILSAFGLYK